MTAPLDVRYYLSTPDTPIKPHHALWRRALPLRRTDFAGTPQSPTASEATYGSYFEAVRSFLEQNKWDALVQSINKSTHAPITADRIDCVDIQLIKHGEWYHPARIGARVCGKRHWFVLNVAVSETGKKFAALEFQNLKYLNDNYPLSFIPAVYKFAHSSGNSDNGFPMFIGEWLSGFHEFHLTRKNPPPETRVVTWNDVGDATRLPADQQGEIIRQATMILSFYYNPMTTEHIAPWHHAAGDFVVNTAGAKPLVKMITVRKYAPLFQPHADKYAPAEIYEALCLFFISTSIRMRLDRLDGVGKWAWHADTVVKPMCLGFREGLSLGAMVHGLPESFVEGFFRNLLSMGEPYMLQMFREWAGKHLKNTDAAQFVAAHLTRHGASLRSAVKQLN